jgi:hypothetical protein
MTVKRKRIRGRPRQDRRDQLAVDAAVALQAVFGLGPQQARDLALAFLEGRPTFSWRPEGLAVSFRLPVTVKGRSDALKRKALMKPRSLIVAAFVAVAAAPHIYGLREPAKAETKA